MPQVPRLGSAERIVSPATLAAARRARKQMPILALALVALAVVYHFRVAWFGVDRPVRVAVALCLALISWTLARGLGRWLAPRLAQHLEPGSIGVAGFLIRLATLLVAALVALRVAGIDLATLTVGASVTAVVLGLAAQQTVGNVLAGVVLLSARPFNVGDRVRFAGFGMDVEATIAAFGLLYVTCTDGEDMVLVPNNTALTMSVRPIREPAAVDMRARLPANVDPEAIEARVRRSVTVATRAEPQVLLEEFDGTDVVVRIVAAPIDPADGARLAREVLRAVADINGMTGPHTMEQPVV